MARSRAVGTDGGALPDKGRMRAYRRGLATLWSILRKRAVRRLRCIEHPRATRGGPGCIWHGLRDGSRVVASTAKNIRIKHHIGLPQLHCAESLVLLAQTVHAKELIGEEKRKKENDWKREKKKRKKKKGL